MAQDAVPAGAPSADGQAPRQRRRRPGGRRVDGVEGAQGAQGQAAQGAGLPPSGKPSSGKPSSGKPGQRDVDKRGGGRHSPPPAPHGDAGGSLLSRIGRGLRSLVTRAPRSQH
jgi:ATP-dependent RNA helicase RhlB